ncbi:g4830 [Coccomyxa viridis]|uniref:G4830 protein n=1 Tax=Coccomyxa viridis TaxID=1274662 RepID=A0ABP1FY42_9CHLO
MTNKQSGTFINGRGQTLYTVEFVPVKPPKALLIFHHGYGEHTGRYDYVFGEIAKAGIAVHSYDCHGHGRSEPLEERDRALIWHFHHVVDDLLAFSKHTRLRYKAGLPAFAGGQSMGALAALHAVLRDQSAWDGIVLGTATIDVEWTWFLKVQAALGNFLATVIPRARIVPAVRGEDMSADQATIESMETDPYNILGNVRARTANELLHAFGHIAQHEGELELPIYAHHGTKDRLANLGAVKRLLRNAASRDVTLYEVPGGYHELFMGPEKDDIIAHINAWVLEHAELKAAHDQQQ